jgi:hypothetical protein
LSCSSSAANCGSRQALPSLNECFGNKIIGHAEIAGQCRRLPEQARLQRLGQLTKCLRIPGARLCQGFTGINFDPVIGDVHLFINPRRAQKGSVARHLFLTRLRKAKACATVGPHKLLSNSS